MHDVFNTRPAWFVLGPLIGLVVVGLVATINQRIGVLGGFSNVLERVDRRTPTLGWKAFLLLGVMIGGFVQRILAGTPTVHGGYGWLTRTFDQDWVVGIVLVVAGGLIGFGAKTAGGCTSGNGLGGCSEGSTASFAATATFMGTAIAVTFLIAAVT